MSDDHTDTYHPSRPTTYRRASVQEKLGLLQGMHEVAGGLQAYSLRGSTPSQEAALRTLAADVGFTDLRGFNKWMEAAHIDYYDLIKVASP